MPAATMAWNSRLPSGNGNVPQSVPSAILTLLAGIRRWECSICSASRGNLAAV
jgi:hypothetical protein